MQDVSVGKMISYFGILALICVLSFMIAKYMVRRGIDRNDIPVDTSERL